MRLHIRRVDDDRLARPVGGGEGDLVEDALHHRLQPPCADILDRRVHLHRDAGDRVDRIVGEVERQPLGRHQRLVLLDEARLGLRQDAAEIVLASAGGARRGWAVGPAARARGPTAWPRGRRPRR